MKLQNILGIYNEGPHKIVSILGIKIKFKRRKYELLNTLKEFICDEENKRELKELVNDLNRNFQLNLSTALLHQKTFSKFKNIHEGKDMVLLASGPSASSYVPIKNAIHIGVNRSFELNKAKLDYIFIQDYSGKTPEYITKINEYERESCVKFYGLTTEHIDEPNRVIPESEAISAKALRYRTDWSSLPYMTPKFAYDISTMPLGCFGSVTFPALQFALWTHPKRIYLVGCDCTIAGYAYDSKFKNFLIPESIILAYREFKKFAGRYYPDIEIVSINPVGLKGLFTDMYQ